MLLITNFGPWHWQKNALLPYCGSSELTRAVNKCSQKFVNYSLLEVLRMFPMRTGEINKEMLRHRVYPQHFHGDTKGTSFPQEMVLKVMCLSFQRKFWMLILWEEAETQAPCFETQDFLEMKTSTCSCAARCLLFSKCIFLRYHMLLCTTTGAS